MYLHICERSWIAWKEKLLQSCLLPSRLDSGREQLIIFLLWVRILISISAHRKCNIFGAGNSSSSRYSLALRRSVPCRGKRHKIMWEELEARAAAAQLDAGNELTVCSSVFLSVSLSVCLSVGLFGCALWLWCWWVFNEVVMFWVSLWLGVAISDVQRLVYSCFFNICWVKMSGFVACPLFSVIRHLCF